MLELQVPRQISPRHSPNLIICASITLSRISCMCERCMCLDRVPHTRPHLNEMNTIIHKHATFVNRTSMNSPWDNLTSRLQNVLLIITITFVQIFVQINTHEQLSHEYEFSMRFSQSSRGSYQCNLFTRYEPYDLYKISRNIIFEKSFS